jgi:hypothetical protein
MVQILNRWDHRQQDLRRGPPFSLTRLSADSYLLEEALTINALVVYMAGYVMIMMRANPFRGPLEGVGPEIQDFFGPRNGNDRSECHLGPKIM